MIRQNSAPRAPPVTCVRARCVRSAADHARSYSYHASGNTTSDRTRTFAYYGVGRTKTRLLMVVGPNGEPPSCKDRRVARVLTLIARDLTERLSRADAARAASLDPAYFSKRFRRAMGVSFSVWNATIRVRQAQRLLECTDFQIREVAAAVGYDDVTTFERNFRRLLGLSPRAYRIHSTTLLAAKIGRHRTPKE